MFAKCPHCKAVISYFTVIPLPGNVSMTTTTLTSVAFCCPLCSVILSATVDPIAIKELRKGSRQ